MLKAVVGFDGSEPAGWALDWAAALVDGAGRIDLVQSVSAAAARHVGRVELEQLGRKRGRDAAVFAHIDRWVADELLLQVAEEQAADLIAVGRVGAGRATELLVGSVTSEVIRKARVPVLVAGGPAPAGRPGRALVMVDGSVHSIHALRVAASWCPGADLVAVHVLSPRTPPDDGWQILRDARGTAGLLPAAVRSRILAGPPLEAILQAAAQEDAQLLFAGYRGLHPVQELLLGSVSSGLVHQARCGVVVVR
jgi:nucleotide-binding universal stress UspA family protein